MILKDVSTLIDLCGRITVILSVDGKLPGSSVRVVIDELGVIVGEKIRKVIQLHKSDIRIGISYSL